MSQSTSARPSRSRKKNAISIIASLKPKRPITASAPDTAPSAQRPPAANCDCARSISVGSCFSSRCSQPSIESGAFAIRPPDALGRDRRAHEADRVDGLADRDRREQRERNQDQDHGRGGEQRGDRASAGRPDVRRPSRTAATARPPAPRRSAAAATAARRRRRSAASRRPTLSLRPSAETVRSPCLKRNHPTARELHPGAPSTAEFNGFVGSQKGFRTAD